MALLDEEAALCVEGSWAPATRSGYLRGCRQWEGFRAEVKLSAGQFARATARQREQWAVRFQVWLMWRGSTPADAAQLVYNASAGLRGRGLGSLLELGSLGRHSRITAVKRGIKRRREEVHPTEASTALTVDLLEKVIRPLTDWELRKIQRWWLVESGEDKAMAERWVAILTVAYYSCWRPSQFTKPTRKTIPWQQWLVRARDVTEGVKGVGWVVRNQKARDSPYTQFFYREGPAEVVLQAVATLQRYSEESGKKGRKWLCWLSSPSQPVGYKELLERWGDGVRGARLGRGVESPYALRRGGATFWFRQGLSWQEVGAANGWNSAQVRRYIMPRQWQEEAPPRAAAALASKRKRRRTRTPAPAASDGSGIINGGDAPGGRR